MLMKGVVVVEHVNMLYLIGLGLGNAKDITVNGLETIRKSKRVYLEAYTSILSVNHKELEDYYNCSLIIADRELVEQSADVILEGADIHDISFLVVGDPLGATTHTDLIIRANERGIPYRIVHNASIMNAIGCCGLQLYNFGETVSIPFWTESWTPDSFIDRIEQNLSHNLHTLCLLDIKVKELSIENMMKGKMVYEAPRYMSVDIAASQLLKAIERRKDDLKFLTPEVRCVGVARIGSSDQTIAVDKLNSISRWRLGEPLHSLVIIGRTHPLEDSMLRIVANANHQ